MGFDSLKTIMWCYISQDYQNYSWCRRQYRLSHNITTSQVKIGMDYYPSLPLQCNSGNVGPQNKLTNITNRLPNNDFLIQLSKCFAKYNNIDNDECAINQVNFAINNRPYAVDNSQFTSAANPDRFGNKTLVITYNQRGWPLIHENRCVGRAIYAMNLEALSKNGTVLSGVSTMTTRPFEILQTYDSTFSLNAGGTAGWLDPTSSIQTPYSIGGPLGPSIYIGNSECHTFCIFDIVYKISREGIEVIGRA